MATNKINHMAVGGSMTLKSAIDFFNTPLDSENVVINGNTAGYFLSTMPCVLRDNALERNSYIRQHKSNYGTCHSGTTHVVKIGRNQNNF